MSSYYRQQLEDWLKTLDVKADVVLDIGGSQLPVKGRTKSWDVKEYQVFDIGNEFDYDDWNLEDDWTKATTANVGGMADIIFCLEVFEYILDDIQAMKNIALCLKASGKAYITVPLIYPTHNEVELDSRRYTERGIHRLAESAGLKVTNTWYRRDKSGLLQAFYSADGMRASKEYPNHDVTGFIVELAK